MTKKLSLSVLLLFSFSFLAVAQEKKSTPPPSGMRYGDLSEDDKRIHDQGPISDGQYIAGGVVGTLFGFGIGNAIQERYSNRGWIFTVGEISSFAIMAAGTSSCTTRTISKPEGCANSLGLYAFGAIAFLGFRIWEIIDVWLGPSVHNRQYEKIKGRMASSEKASPLRFTLLPVGPSNDTGVGFIYKF